MASRKAHKNKNIETLLLHVKMGRAMDMYKILLKTPQIIDVPDVMARTAVHWAAMRQQAD